MGRCPQRRTGGFFLRLRQPPLQHPSMQLDADKLRQRLELLFQENFETFGELGAAISVWQNGKELLELHGGFRDARREQPWTKDTIVLIWSATKGIGSACLLHVLQEHKIDIERHVGEVWPEFAQAGKETITLGQLLSHQAGLAALDRKVDLLDYAAVIDALAKQEPNWPPGTAHGYHARTFGFLVDELVRRISGIKLAEYWRETFAERTITWMKMALSDGIDRVFQIPTAFSAGFMKDSRPPRENLTALSNQVSERPIFGKSMEAFGHPGAGGSHAFADPENGISFAYVMNQMEQSVLPNEKSLRLVDAIYAMW